LCDGGIAAGVQGGEVVAVLGVRGTQMDLLLVWGDYDTDWACENECLTNSFYLMLTITSKNGALGVQAGNASA
jgi:hypothetical protein